MYVRAKAVKKLGSIFSQVNKPRNTGGVTNIMEEFSEILMVSLDSSASPAAAAFPPLDVLLILCCTPV